MVFVVPVGYYGRADGTGIGTMESYGRRVVMHALRGNLKPLYNFQRQQEPDAASALGHQRVKHPRYAIVVQRLLLVSGKPYRLRGDRRHPFGDAIKRGRGIQDVMDQRRQRLTVVYAALPAGAYAGTHYRRKIEAFQEMSHHGVGAQYVGV